MFIEEFIEFKINYEGLYEKGFLLGVISSSNLWYDYEVGDDYVIVKVVPSNLATFRIYLREALRCAEKLK